MNASQNTKLPSPFRQGISLFHPEVLSGALVSCGHDVSALADTSSDFYNGRAFLSEKTDTCGMDRLTATDWRARLLDEISRQGTSQRAISIAAGHGPGLVNSWFKEGKDPTIDKLLSVCQVLNVSLTYLLYGVSASRETEEILELLELNPEARSAVLQILKSRRIS